MHRRSKQRGLFLGLARSARRERYLIARKGSRRLQSLLRLLFAFVLFFLGQGFRAGRHHSWKVALSFVKCIFCFGKSFRFSSRVLSTLCILLIIDSLLFLEVLFYALLYFFTIFLEQFSYLFVNHQVPHSLITFTHPNSIPTTHPISAHPKTTSHLH